MMTAKIYTTSFAKVYPLLVAKAERKGRSQSEVDEVIGWLTGYTPADLQQQLTAGVTYEVFFAQAPQLNPRRKQITGVICGVRVETIVEPLMQEIRYLDKLIDELAQGKSIAAICRTS